MQNKSNQHNLKKSILLILILIACPVIVSAVITQTDAISTDTIASTDSSSQSKTSNTAAQSQEKTSEQNLETAKKNIEDLINKFKDIKADYDSKTITYGFLIENSIDANIAARALLDEAAGFMKIAEFKKDYEIVPDKAVYPEITSEDKAHGIRILNFDATIQDNSLVLNSKLQVLNKDKSYSINYMIGSPPENPTQDSKDLIFSDEKSEQIYTRVETGEIRFSQKKILFDTLKRRGFDISKGINLVELRVYDKLGVTGDPTKLDEKGELEVDGFITNETVSLTEEAQEISYGKNTKFEIEFFPSRKSLKLSVELDERDRDDFYYQFEFSTAKSNIPILFPETRLSKAEMKKVEEVNNLIVPYNYFDIGKQSDVKSIKLNIYEYSTQEKPIYYKEEDLTAKPPSSYGVQCTKCNDDNICTLSECKEINKDNCIWIPDEGAWQKLKDFVGFGSYNTITNADKESGMCKEKKSITDAEECRSRCESRSCSSEKENLCKADKKCMLDEDKCIVNPQYNQIAVMPKSTTDQLLLLKKNYGSQITKSSQENNVDEAVIYAIIMSESKNLDPKSISSTGCVGLMQICDTEALSLPNIFDLDKIDKSCTVSKCSQDDPRLDGDKSIQAGTKIFFDKRNSFKGYVNQDEFVIASYNIGQGVISDVLNRLGSKKDITLEQVANEIKSADLDKYSVYSKLTAAEKKAKIAAVKNYVQKVIKYRDDYNQLIASGMA